MIQKIKHFGMEFQRRKYDFKLVENEYCLPNNKVSLPFFVEMVLLDYEKYPKIFLLNYLTALLKFYDNCDKLSSKQKRIQTNAKKILEKAKKFRNDRHEKILCHIYKLNKKDKEKIKLYESKYLKRLNNYDFEESIEGRLYSKDWCRIQESEVKENYKLNMQYFSSLNKKEFDEEIDKFLKNNKEFEEIFDLNNAMFKSGYYIMVLDEYKQIYVGTTDNIAKRICSHWQSKKEFDRLIFPWHAVTTSKLSIDSFRHLDTTRIYAYFTKDIYSLEEEYISSFLPKFVLNRCTGGNLIVFPRKQYDLRENK